MSMIGGAGDEGVVFSIRANRAALQEDLRGMVADVKKATAEIAAAFEQINSMTPAGPGGPGGAGAAGGGAAGMLAEANTQAVALKDSMTDVAATSAVVNKALDETAEKDPFKKATESADKFTKGVRAMMVVMLAFRAAEAASEVFKEAAIGFREGKTGEGFIRGAEGAIKMIPIVGGPAFETGQNIRAGIGALRPGSRFDDTKDKFGRTAEMPEEIEADARRQEIHTREMVRKAKERDAQGQMAREEFQQEIDAIEEIQAEAEKMAKDAAENKKQLNAELKEEQLRTAGKIDEAERAHLDEQIRQRIEAVEKYGQDAIDTEKAIGEEQRKQLAQTQAERERKKKQKLDHDREVAEEEQDQEKARADKAIRDEADAMAKQDQEIVDAEKRRSDQIDDIKASTEEKRLRRTGRAAEAEAQAIERRAQKDVEAAKGDAEKIAAIIASAEEDVKSIRGSGAGGPAMTGDVIAASSARLLNIMGGNTNNDLLGVQKSTLDVQQKALDVLKDIEKKTGAAVTTP